MKKIICTVMVVVVGLLSACAVDEVLEKEFYENAMSYHEQNIDTVCDKYHLEKDSLLTLDTRHSLLPIYEDSEFMGVNGNTYLGFYQEIDELQYVQTNYNFDIDTNENLKHFDNIYQNVIEIYGEPHCYDNFSESDMAKSGYYPQVTQEQASLRLENDELIGADWFFENNEIERHISLSAYNDGGKFYIKLTLDMYSINDPGYQELSERLGQE